MFALGVWSIALEPGKKTELAVIKDLRITNAALDAQLADENARTSVKLTFSTPSSDDVEDEEDDEEDDDEDKEPNVEQKTTVLCSLTPGKIEQATLDLILNETDEVEFEVVGKNTIHLSGNYIEQMPPADYDSEEDSDNEDAYDLEDVSSDVEVDPAELDMMDDESDQDDSHRFEEIVDESPKQDGSKKRARESDAAEAEADGEVKLSKKQQKKLNKKLKAENGAAVPNGDAKEKADKENKTQKSKDKPAEEKEKKDQEKKDEKKSSTSKTLPGGLIIEDKKLGTGKAAKKGDLVSMRYIGKFPDSKKVFDSNTKGKPFTFKVGAGEVIKGWDEGVVGMQAGGERLLVVPPALGYGSRKIDSIPANSTLRFEVKLLEIKKN